MDNFFEGGGGAEKEKGKCKGVVIAQDKIYKRA